MLIRMIFCQAELASLERVTLNLVYPELVEGKCIENIGLMTKI